MTANEDVRGRDKDETIDNNATNDAPLKKKPKIDYKREIQLSRLGLTSNQVLSQRIVEDAYADAMKKQRQNEIGLSDKLLTSSFHSIIGHIRNPQNPVDLSESSDMD